MGIYRNLDGSTVESTFPSIIAPNLPHIVQARITATTGVYVTTADVTAAANIYWTPSPRGNIVRMFDGTSWKYYALTETPLALSLTDAKIYDVFAYLNAGVPALELSAAWATDTTRTDALAYQDGVEVKSADHTRMRVATIRASGTNTTEDSVLKRFVHNFYNQVEKSVRVAEATNTWTYTTDTNRNANNSAANRIQIVNGALESIIDLNLIAFASNSGSTVRFHVGIGEDGTTTDSLCIGNYGRTTDSAITISRAITNLQKFVPLGFHYYAWLERSEATGTTTWYGDGASSPDIQTGMGGIWKC